MTFNIKQFRKMVFFENCILNFYKTVKEIAKKDHEKQIISKHCSKIKKKE